jgi:hypothetical protein
MPSPAAWTSIQLKNFRAFEDTGRIDYAPVTLLFGRNSSGKTSILRAPLLLKQMLQQPPGREPAFSGADVDFGSYIETVYSGDTKRDITIAASTTLGRMQDMPLPAEVWRALGEELRSLGHAFTVELTLHWNQTRAKTIVSRIGFSATPDSPALVEMTRTGLGKYNLRIGSGRPRRMNSELTPESLRYMALRADSENVNDFYFSYFAFNLGNTLEVAASRLVHVGPLRDRPSRAYRTDQVGVPGGRDTIDVLRNGGREAADVIGALKTLKMASDVRLDKLAPGYSAILLKQPRTGRMENLADVGFGVSQVLPILATLATVEPGSTVLIEQPELHLHPEAQGNFADVLLDLGERRNLGLVIETHSEHILLRLQRRVAESRVPQGHVTTLFVDRGRVDRGEIDASGRVERGAIPEGFFEEEWSDLVELATAAAKANK